MNSCKYLNKKTIECGKTCKNNYCDKHSIYENNIDPKDMINCSICVCGVRFIKDTFKNCANCRNKRAQKKREYQEKKPKCQFIFSDKTKCEKISENGQYYCGCHFQYNDIDPNVLNKMNDCNKCKRRTKNDMYCDKCVDYIKEQYVKEKENVIKCGFITKNDEPCPYQKFGEYY